MYIYCCLDKLNQIQIATSLINKITPNWGCEFLIIFKCSMNALSLGILGNVGNQKIEITSHVFFWYLTEYVCFLQSVEECMNDWSSPLLSSCLRETHGSRRFQSQYRRWMLCVLMAWPPLASLPPCLARSPQEAPPSTARPAAAPQWAPSPAASPTPCTPWKTPTTTP